LVCIVSTTGVTIYESLTFASGAFFKVGYHLWV